MSGRWQELISSVSPAAEFGAPAAEDAVRSAEQALGHPLPADLRAAVLEFDGATTDESPLLWPLAQIVEDNLWVRSFADYQDSGVPFAEICFFAGAGEGSWFGSAVQPEVRGVHVWAPIDGTWTWVAPGLEQFVRGWLSGEITI